MPFNAMDLTRRGRVAFGAAATLLAACSSAPPGGPIARLEVEPRAVLLTSPDEALTLVVRAFDEGGREVSAPALAFSSSNPDALTVDGAASAASPRSGRP